MTRRVVVSWSTGKDSAWCLHELRREPGIDIVGLLTTVTPSFDRVSIHGTRHEVLVAQASGLGLPVWEVELPYPCPNDAYETAMATATAAVVEAWSVTHVAFGDLFLEDVRAYREAALAETELEPLFPLWGRDTSELAREMLAAGIEAVIVSAPESSEVVDLVGRAWDAVALAGLPASVDPCGENGEFHTCLVAGPELERIEHRVGEIVSRDEARYADLLLASETEGTTP